MKSTVKRVLHLVFVLLTIWTTAVGQDTIKIFNPSLEGEAKPGLQPKFDFSTNVVNPVRDWFDVGKILFPTESGYDVHPNNIWRVTKEPSHGNTYVGIACRANGSYEGLGQVLSEELVQGKCYELSMDLATSTLFAPSRIPGLDHKQSITHRDKAVLQIVGFLTLNEPEELLAESLAIEHKEWQRYTFQLSPQQTIASIRLLSRSLAEPPTNGYLLIDNLSDIIEVPCEQ